MTQPATAAATTSKGMHKDELFRIGTERVEALVGMQKELIECFQKIHRERLARVMEETKLASEFAEKVLSAGSIPEAMAVFQIWISQRLELFAEDGRKFLDDSQKVSNAALRLLSRRAKKGVSGYEEPFDFILQRL